MQVLVVCRANVCRSRLAAGLLAGPLGDLGAEVVSAGVQPSEPGVECLATSAALSDAGLPGLEHVPRAISHDDLARADLVLASSRDVASAIAVLDLSSRPKVFTLRRAAAIAAWVAGSLPAGPDGAPPLPPRSDRPGRWAWFVEELDAGRGFAQVLEPVPDAERPDDVPDPHLGEIDHALAAAAVAAACRAFAEAAAAVIEHE